MVPIHDTDLAEERWAKEDWKNYELWEKVEQREKRYRRLWVLGTLIVFLLLSSVPVILDRFPKWTTLKGARVLATELNRIKKDASVFHKSYRLRFPKAGILEYSVEELEYCGVKEGKKIRTGNLLSDPNQKDYRLLTLDKGERLGVASVVREFCYDSLQGNLQLGARNDSGSHEKLSGFALISVKDLTQSRMDRVSVVFFKGQAAEISFD